MKEKLNFRGKIALCLLLSWGYYANSFALDYYWIGKGTNNNWSLPGNWATTSGATVSDVQVPPTLNDNVIFDENSFVNRVGVTVNTAATCDSIIFRNVTVSRATLTVNAGLTVKGSMFLTAGMTVNGGYGQIIQFQSERPDETLATAGVNEMYPSFVFTGSTNWTTDGDLSLRRGTTGYGDLTFSSTGNLTVNGNMTVMSFTKTGGGNVDISGYLETPTSGYYSGAINFSGGGNMTVGSHVATVSGFAFSGNGNLTVNGYLSANNPLSAAPYDNRSVYLGGTGTKTIKGDLTAGNGIIAEGGIVNIQDDLIMNGYNGNNPAYLTGANPSVFGGCKMNIGGNIVNNGDATKGGRFSISGAGTEVEVKGGYATLYGLYVINGGKFYASETVQCNDGWYTYGTGNIPFTAATAPKLISIGTGDLIANAADVYNNVEFFGTPASSSITNVNYHTINQGTYNSVTFMAGSGKISTTAGITADSLIIYPQAEYIFSNTTTVNDYLEMKTRPCGGMIHVSGGIIAMGAGSTVVAGNLWLQNNKITGTTPYTAINSGDGAGNTGWNFSDTPNTYYWIGGAGNWNDINHWANASNGEPGSGCVPTILDDVIFDGQSGLNGTERIVIPAGYFAYCNNMTWNGITGTPTLDIGNMIYSTATSISRLYIGGSLELNADMKILNPGSTNLGTSSLVVYNDNRGLHFVSNRNAPYETITTNGVAIPGYVYFYSREITSGSVGGWVFQDDWTGNAQIYFQQGSLDFNGKPVTAYWFSSINSLTRTLNISNSTVIMANYWNYYGTGSNMMTNTLTDNSLIKVTNAGAHGTGSYGFYAKVGDEYHNVEFTTTASSAIYDGIFNKITLLGTSSTLNGTIETDSLIFAAKPGTTYTLSNNITVNKYLQGPDCGIMSNLTASSTRTITMGEEGIAGENVRMKNMKITGVNITGGPMPSGGYLVENGALVSGTGWNVVPIYVEGRYYWVGGTGNWSDISHWSDVSGGAGGAFCIPPTSHNTVVFDENSFKANNCIVTVDASATCDSILWVGTPSETPTLRINSGLTVSGSAIWQQDMKILSSASFSYIYAITFNSTRMNESLKTNGAEVTVNSSYAKIPLIFNVTGEWDFPDGLTSKNYEITFGGTDTAKWIFGGALNGGTVYFNCGTLDLSGTTSNFGSFTCTTGHDPNRELIIKDAIINCAGTWNYDGILPAANSLNSVINFNNISAYSSNGGTMTTAANQIFNDINFAVTDATSVGTINASSGTNTTQFRKVIFSTPAGIVNNGKYEYLRFKVDGTMNNIETDTLHFANNNSARVYTFTSGATSAINKKWYGSGLPCFNITIQSSVNGTPAYVNVGKEAATIYNPADILYLDYICVNGIIANQGPDLALLRKGSGSPDSETMNGRIYNAMTLADGWVMDTHNPILNPLPNRTIPCDAFPYTIDPVQYVTTPESAYEWRKGGPTGTILNPDNPNLSTWTINDASEADVYYLKVNYHPEGTTCVLDGTSVISAIAVDSLIWTGAVNKDWNNAKNWNLPDDGGVSSYAPTVCTNVLIQKGLSIYPDLLATDYTREFYEKAACNNIWFEHGGEVVRTDSLHYAKAFVQITLAANRWNMLSVPLRNMFPGDFYQTYPCPHADSLRIYQQLFAMSNPQTGQSDTSPTGGWTKPFNNPDISMPAGFGYAIQLIDEGKILLSDGSTAPVSNENWTPSGQRHSIWLPKNDAFYNTYIIYSSDGKGNPPFTGSCDIDKTFTTVRNYPDNYRFIYEGGDGFGTGSWTGDITLTTSGATDKEKQVIVGNPFMAHWSFNDFYAQNNELITEEYKVLESDNDAAFVTYSPSLASWNSDEKIAPMQSILVTSVKAFGATALKTRVTATAQNPGVILKSSTANPDLLKIVATKDGKQNQSYVLYDASASNNYLLGEDSYKLFVDKVTKPVVVYTRSSDGYALDINVFGDSQQMIPLGIRTSETGTIYLQFEGAENFDGAFLFDNQTGKKINLKETPAYSFEKTTSDLFVDGRFSLLIGKSATGNLSPVQGTISIFTAGSQLQVSSGNGDIEEIQVFDMQGRLLHKATNIGSPVYAYDLSNSGMYIVKATNGQEVAVKKVINP